MRFSREELQARKTKVFNKKQSAVGWFDPPQLIRTGWQAFLSTTIGYYADRRETQAGLSSLYWYTGEPAFHDFSNHSDFSFDFVADSGDGWKATRAMADLMLRENIKLGSAELNRPSVVVFGGDLVYPAANSAAYEHRMIGPFTYAAIENGLGDHYHEDPFNTSSPRVFAIPGNHDWYDGLSAFRAKFCRARFDPDSGKRSGGRWVGPWAAEQQRSYFALRLPHNWWLWGVDIQLSGWIDQPQGHYFEDLACHMELLARRKGQTAKLIVCTAEPSWVKGKIDGPRHFEQLGYILRRALRHNIDVRGVFTGDSHHYSRYHGRLESAPEDLLPTPVTCDCSFVTAGGGGAFTHPTHQLPDTIDLDSDEGSLSEGDLHTWSAQLRKAELQQMYPDRWQSILHSFWNVLFPLLNLRFVLLMGVIWAAIGWEYAVFPLWVLLGAGFIAFAHLARDHGGWSWKLVTLGGIHATVQLAMGHYLGPLAEDVIAHRLASLLAGLLGLGEWISTELTIGLVWGLAGGFGSAFVMGLYLLICTLTFGHHNEAFSAIRSTRWKNFLRIKINENGVARVHAIGLDKPDEEPRMIEEFVL